MINKATLYHFKVDLLMPTRVTSIEDSATFVCTSQLQSVEAHFVATAFLACFTGKLFTVLGGFVNGLHVTGQLVTQL